MELSHLSFLSKVIEARFGVRVRVQNSDMKSIIRNPNTIQKSKIVLTTLTLQSVTQSLGTDFLIIIPNFNYSYNDNHFNP